MRTGLTFCRPHSEQAGQSKTSKNLQPIGTKKPRTCKLAALLFPRMHSPTRAAVTLPHTRMRLHACAHAHYATAHLLCYRRLPDMLNPGAQACMHACVHMRTAFVLAHLLLLLLLRHPSRATSAGAERLHTTTARAQQQKLAGASSVTECGNGWWYNSHRNNLCASC